MSDAQIERTVVNIKSDSYNEFFVARGEVIKFDGFLRVYNEGTDDEIEEEKGVLPVLSINENLNLLSISSRESFSRPPSRFTEASLVKKLEELGIGRPATYATTISTIQNRGYIAKGVNEGLDRNYNLITKVDKIKWIYLRDNPYKIEALAFLDYDMPKKIEEFLENFADRRNAFNSILLNKLEGFFADLEWELNLNPYATSFKTIKI